MGQSYRIRTELGTNKTLNIQLDQDFEFLEILSLKILQSEIYNRNCADYGVVVGRVTANGGYGIPNARVSIFIPIESIDESNPLIQSIYPYKSVTDRNEDGYRYNLLPYEKSYSTHAATGTFPSRGDALTGATVVEIYDKYYKFTTKTNESGDYMIMGAPLGEQLLFMDVDLSDIGDFSLTPQDLVRMGLATEEQVNGNTFRTSTDLNSLPQIITFNRNIEISPLWGDDSLCQIAINRMDFDLRDDANVDIQPTAVFMGSIYSTADNFRIKSDIKIGGLTLAQGVKPRDDFGNLCSLQAGPGQIIALRQTIFQDQDGNPIIEQYGLEQNGNLIDGEGSWVIELPMNLDYLVTNEFGQTVLSNDPSIGIPTKAKYRFKIKWQQSQNLTEQVRRPYYLVPNVKEYGWSSLFSDPNLNPLKPDSLRSSYYFGLDWSGYTEGFTGQAKLDRLNEIIDCEDTFYEFLYNRVYTVAGFIDEYKSGARGRFVGIKEIGNDACEQSINKFPVNEGFRNFDLTFFVYSILLYVLQIIGPILIIAYHAIGRLWEFMGEYGREFVNLLYGIGLAFAVVGALMLANIIPNLGGIPMIALGITVGLLALLFSGLFRLFDDKGFQPIKLPSMTYPTCVACECSGENSFDGLSASFNSFFTPFSQFANYLDIIKTTYPISVLFNGENQEIGSLSLGMAIGTNPNDKANINVYKTTKSSVYTLPSSATAPLASRMYSFTTDLPMAERINLFNQRGKYFNNSGGINRISVSFDSPSNSQIEHFDNTLTVLLTQKLETGEMLTFVSPTRSGDLNFLTTAYASQTGYPQGISGIPKNPTTSQYVVEYCDPDDQMNNLSRTYNLSYGTTGNTYLYPADIEYFQVVTALTVSEASTLWNQPSNQFFPTLMNSNSSAVYVLERGGGWAPNILSPVAFRSLYSNFDNQYITILQRGVDPYSPKYTNKFGLGKIFGYPNENGLTVTASTRLNIPIQKLNSTYMSVQQFNSQNNIFYPSHFFEGGSQFSAFTTFSVGYYSALDRDNYPQLPQGSAAPFATVPTGIVSGVNVFRPAGASPSFERQYATYQFDEDISGVAYYSMRINACQGTITPGCNTPPNTVETFYWSKVLLPSFTGTTNRFQISSKVRNIMRTDRLPSSDVLDGSDWSNNPGILQQNLAFGIYSLNAGQFQTSTATLTSGADIVPPDISGQTASQNVVDSFECENLVSLTCYSGNGVNFGIIPDCPSGDTVENGCYVLATILWGENGDQVDKDIQTFYEWAFRFRFFFGLCRGVLAQSFTNNWMNGSLFMFPIQVDRTYSKNNKPNPPKFPDKLIYFDTATNNFYYRSSPYFTGTTSNQPFIGRPTTADDSPTNSRNLLFPTTIVNLGMKDEVYKEIIFDPGTNAYIMRTLAPTSYSDTSDLINMFVISRITNNNFLKRIKLGKNDALSLLFTRYSNVTFRRKQRLDADITQLLSINSELGLVPFSPEFYSVIGSTTDPVVILGSLDQPTMGVFFSSTTVDLQVKDFLSPGRLNFRPNPFVNAITYDFGIKSQVVPFYQWELRQTPSAPPNIFGSERNDWKTNISQSNPGQSGIRFGRYQSMDRRRTTNPNYFVNFTTFPDTAERGYIFSSDAAGDYRFQDFPGMRTVFTVGLPNQFYFGIMKGQTALDKFKTKYLPNE